MGTTPTLVHHPTATPTYALHPTHPLTAYTMMRPTLTVAPPLSMTPALAGGKGHPSATYSNDLGPPIFMPCKSA